MASTYSDLKIELIGTGEQAGTWGTTTNTNLGTALQEAITGSADVAFSSGDVTLTLTNSNAAQIGRNLRLNLTGTSGGARNLILGSEMQVEKLYLINNTLADAVTVKNTTGTGIAVPAGKTMFVFNNGTNVVDAIDNLPSGATVGGVAISTASGTVTSVDVSGGTTGLTTSGGPVTSSGTITIAGTLAVANGGTGITSLGTGVATFLGTPSLTSQVTGNACCCQRRYRHNVFWYRCSHGSGAERNGLWRYCSCDLTYLCNPGSWNSNVRNSFWLYG
jgi:hypothetical protein